MYVAAILVESLIERPVSSSFRVSNKAKRYPPLTKVHWGDIEPNEK